MPSKTQKADVVDQVKVAPITRDVLPEVPLAVASAAVVQSWLDRNGVAYHPVADIPMSSIDEKRSRSNQARAVAVLPDSVERFTVAMKQGDVFPPIVVYPAGSKFVIIDGNNRHAARQKVSGADTISAIVISEDTPSEIIQLLTVEANAHHGVTPPLSWRVEQAFSLVNIGFTDAQAAEVAMVSITALKQARAVKSADERAREMKIKKFTDLALVSRQSLSTIFDDPVFYRAAHLAADTDMTIDNVKDMVRGVKELRSESSKLEFIESVAQQRVVEREAKKATRNKASASSPKHALASGIGKILALDELSLARSVVTDHDRMVIGKKLEELAEKVIALQIAIEQTSNG